MMSACLSDKKRCEKRGLGGEGAAGRGKAFFDRPPRMASAADFSFFAIAV